VFRTEHTDAWISSLVLDGGTTVPFSDGDDIEKGQIACVAIDLFDRSEFLRILKRDGKRATGRRPIAVLLDEAQVIVNSPATLLTHQLDVIKSVAADTGVPHILFGTYGLLERTISRSSA
jgi:hypothetical protein